MQKKQLSRGSKCLFIALGMLPARVAIVLALSAAQREGSDETHLPRVFEPFLTTKGEGEGVGLGLSTAFGLLRAWGGERWDRRHPATTR